MGPRAAEGEGVVGPDLLSCRPPRWLRQLACRLWRHELQDRHFANGCLHLCTRCGWAVGVLPPKGERIRALRVHGTDRSQQLAVDFLLAVLAGDSAGRDAAHARLIEDPAASVSMLGMITLALAPEGRVREQLQSLAAMGELRAAVGEAP